MHAYLIKNVLKQFGKLIIISLHLSLMLRNLLSFDSVESIKKATSHDILFLFFMFLGISSYSSVSELFLIFLLLVLVFLPFLDLLLLSSTCFVSFLLSDDDSESE